VDGVLGGVVEHVQLHGPMQERPHRPSVSYIDIGFRNERQRHIAEVCMPATTTTVGIRYMIDDVADAVAFYTTHLGFTVEQDAAPAFAAVSRDGVRLLLSGPTSSGRRPMPDGTRPVPGGWNRLHLQVGDLAAEVDRLRAAGLKFRNDIITGPGGSQILLEDPSGNPVELFQPAR
jgi:catechol 2,3-dioxygenase-like lactoylglutathione lyase family enzyme